MKTKQTSYKNCKYCKEGHAYTDEKEFVCFECNLKSKGKTRE